MNWAEICHDPVLSNLPFKIEMDKWGHIVMSPVSNEHGMYQAKIVALLSRILNTGTLITECSVQTREGVKVADVAWASDDFMTGNRGQNPFLEAPELCIEILSPSNTATEIDEKKEWYFARGAKEFWMCDKNGNLAFHKNTGRVHHSELVSSLPNRVVI